jgi:hypothetical protein
MADKHEDDSKPNPEPGSAADLFPDPKPPRDPGKDLEDKGEPPGGGNFA